MLAPSDNCEYWAIVLAAGRSDRMGREKAALPWLDDLALLPWTMNALSTNGWNPLVVTRPEHFEFWKTNLGEDRVALNPHPEFGKTTSLATGIRRLPPTAKWVLLTSVDQPRLPELYHRLRQASAHSPSRILVPDNAGRRGHPVILSASLLPELLAMGEDSMGLRGLLDRYESEIERLPDCHPESLRWDFNTPEAYQEALIFFREQLAANPKT